MFLLRKHSWDSPTDENWSSFFHCRAEMWRHQCNILLTSPDCKARSALHQLCNLTVSTNSLKWETEVTSWTWTVTGDGDAAVQRPLAVFWVMTKFADFYSALKSHPCNKRQVTLIRLMLLYSDGFLFVFCFPHVHIKHLYSSFCCFMCTWGKQKDKQTFQNH